MVAEAPIGAIYCCLAAYSKHANLTSPVATGTNSESDTFCLGWSRDDGEGMLFGGQAWRKARKKGELAWQKGKKAARRRSQLNGTNIITLLTDIFDDERVSTSEQRSNLLTPGKKSADLAG